MMEKFLMALALFSAYSCSDDGGEGMDAGQSLDAGSDRVDGGREDTCAFFGVNGDFDQDGFANEIDACPFTPQEVELDGSCGRPELANAQLKCADLRNADLSTAVLNLADLSFTDLSRANLSGSFMLLTNLSGANLFNADLSRSAVEGADLSGANLTGTNLIRTVLEGVDFTDVTWGNTTCPDGTNSDTNGTGNCLSNLSI